MNKKDVAELLNNIGALLEIKGENNFKVNAYYNGAKVIENLDYDIIELVKEDKLKDIKGIGKALTGKITEFVNTGELEYYNALVDDTPKEIFEFLKIPGLGPKKVRIIYYTLGILTIGELELACTENRLLNYKGFGQKTQEKIAEGIRNYRKYSGKLLYPDAVELADKLLNIIKLMKTVKQCSVTGELRRCMETISSIDVVVSSDNMEGLISELQESGLFEVIYSCEKQLICGKLNEGIPLNVNLSTIQEYVPVLFKSTGRSEHVKQINSFLDFNIKDAFKSEEDIYGQCGMSYIVPELREHRGEIEAARENKLPKLVTPRDIKGIFHVHTSYSDGVNTIEEMASVAKAMGYSYLGIGDHSKSSFYARGLSEVDVRKQLYDISLFNDKDTGIRVLKGIECDILEDGSLDFDDSILEAFDYVIASVHSRFNMDKVKMTERIKRAIGNRYVTIIGHLTGRVLLYREPYNIDIEDIIRTAADYGKVIEINANPYRLDMDWRLIKDAKGAGAKFVINPDAHNAKGIYDTVYGVNIARKGWLEPDDIINTMSLQKVLNFLHINKTSR